MINGFAAEQSFRRLVAGCRKIKSFKLPSSIELVKIASSTELGKRRLALAQPHLLKEFGIDYRHPRTGKLSRSIHWHQVPPRLILDYVFGIDAVVMIAGYAIAVDVTANPNAIEDKVAKLFELKPLWQPLGIDNACACLVSGHSEEIWPALKSVIRAPNPVAIAI